MTGYEFHRSSFCGVGGCVEVATPSADVFLVRDAKDTGSDAPVLQFDRAEWEAFLAGVHAAPGGGPRPLRFPRPPPRGGAPPPPPRLLAPCTVYRVR